MSIDEALQSHSTKRQKLGAKSQGIPSGTTRGSACDQCHRRKERCSGRIPCDRCNSSNNVCTYSLGRPLGKPKGRRNNVNTRGSTKPARRGPVFSLMAEGCRAEVSKTPQGMDLDVRNGMFVFGNVADDEQSQPQGVTADENADTLESLNTDTTGTFQFILDGASPQWPPLTSPDIGETTSELLPFTPALSTLGNIHDNSTSQKTLTFSPTTQSWLGPSIPTVTNNQNASCILGDDFPLGIIAALYNQQESISWASISETLLVAREGLDAVSQYVSKPSSLTTPASISSTVVIASFLILQQALACYTELSAQAAARFERSEDGESDSTEPLCIGEFHIRGSESCKSVLEALVKAELSRGRIILARLQQVADELHNVAGDKTGLLEVAFRRSSASWRK